MRRPKSPKKWSYLLTATSVTSVQGIEKENNTTTILRLNCYAVDIWKSSFVSKIEQVNDVNMRKLYSAYKKRLEL